jgi:XTP/dITP diphosphohydrolase
LPACVEDGQDFSANARKKAVHYGQFVSGLVLGDDSGLEVDALHGAPGIFSRRFAGPNATDAQNNMKLLRELEGVPDGKRGARFVCALAVARSGTVVAEFTGKAVGQILEQPRGAGGFGYDPLFFDPFTGKTFAELSAAEKLERSHRGAAFRQLSEWLFAHGEGIGA